MRRKMEAGEMVDETFTGVGVQLYMTPSSELKKGGGDEGRRDVRLLRRA